MRSQNYTHMRTHIHAHTGSHITWGSYERKWARVMHSLSYMQTHAPAHRRTHTHVFMVTHTAHKAVPLHAHRWFTTYFPLTVAYMLTQITHTSLCLHASLHSTFNPQASFFITFTAQRITINFSLMLRVRHVQQLTGGETICNSMPCFYCQIKM